MTVFNLVDNKHATLVYYDDEKIIHHVFHHALDSHNLRLVLNTGVDLLKKHKSCKWLSDNTAIDPHSQEDTDWINNDWLPRAIAAGWKYWALIVPDAVKARMNMNEFVNSFYAMGIRIMVFTDANEAHAWLKNVDHA